MNCVGRILKKILLVVILLPIIMIALYIMYEILGMVVNEAATSNQTRRMEKHIESLLQNAVILDSYSETGNTSGTGNHVDMFSAVAFQTDDDLEQILNKMSAEYEFNATGCWIQSVDVMLSYKLSFKEQGDEIYLFLDEMQLPDDKDDCYVFVQTTSAPFADNIVGH